MATKKLKKTAKKAAPTPRRTAPKPAPVAQATPATPVPTVPAGGNDHVVHLAPAALLPRTPAPMTRSRLLSPAQKRGAELVRFLRIHTKSPYASRGMKAIHVLAVEVAHLGRLELKEVDAAHQ